MLFANGVLKEFPCKEYLEKLPVGIYLVEASLESQRVKYEKIRFVNTEFTRLTGWSRQDIENDPYWWFNHLHPEDAPQVLKSLQVSLEKDPPYGSLLYRFQRKTRDYIWIKDYFSLLDWSGPRILWTGLWIEFTREMALEEELREKEDFFRLFITKAPVGIFLYDEKIIYANPYVEKILEYSLEELRQKYVWELVPPEYREEIRNLVEQRLRGEKVSKNYYECVIRTKTGKERFVRFYTDTVKYKGRFLGVGIGIDITPEKYLEKRLTEAVFFDSLTGLPNRRLFLEKLKVLLARAERRRNVFLVCILDLSNFREINTVFGSHTGNLILKEVARRLQRTLRKGDVKSRLFADKFGLVLTELQSHYGIWVVMEKLKNIFKKPFYVEDQEVYLEARFGAALYPRDGKEAEELLQKAEIALKRSKEKEETWTFYSEEMGQELVEDSFFRKALLEGLQRREFFLMYQPIFDLRTRKVIGLEVLLRWKHPTLGMVPPAKFIPVAEKSGFIFELGDFVLTQAFKEVRELQGHRNYFLALNFSAKQFQDPNLPEKIEKTLRTYGFPPDSFLIEITETTAMENPQRSQKILYDLRSLGVKIALDDFGIGYSSMQYLIELEIDKIKIDRQFVTAMMEKEKALKVVNTVVDLSHSIEVRCVAEGIETEAQLNRLLDLGCDEGQGFFLAPPMDIESLMRFLNHESGGSAS